MQVVQPVLPITNFRSNKRRRLYEKNNFKTKLPTFVRMLKLRIIAGFVLLSFVALQGHNVLPHLHEVNHHIKHAQQPHHHHHTNDNSSVPEKDTDCDHFRHSEELGKEIVKPQEKQNQNRTVFSLSDLSAILYPPLLKYEAHSPPFYPPGKDSPLHLIFLSHSVPLRAPPVFFIA
jgi:hypothetical protein